MDKKALTQVQALKTTEHWGYIEKLLNERYLAHNNQLHTAKLEEVQMIQGRIAELKEIYNWFDYRVEEEKLKLEGVKDKVLTPDQEEY